MVYPRVCGGTATTGRPVVESGGLSPRVRGNRIGKPRGAPSGRSIPACAGEPFAGFLVCTPWRVYPRVCGGTMQGVIAVVQVVGLSPRVRGNLRRPHSRWLCPRSIPACAGEPLKIEHHQHLSTVYPRVCGGTVSNRGFEQLYLGLSPRVRGNLYRTFCAVRKARSIPACAGEPLTVCRKSKSMPVYPRVCGGTSALTGQGTEDVGLSPRVRGNHGYAVHERSVRRSIPACAGEPTPCEAV